jgi:hypothetical protein
MNLTLTIFIHRKYENIIPDCRYTIYLISLKKKKQNKKKKLWMWFAGEIGDSSDLTEDLNKQMVWELQVRIWF